MNKKAALFTVMSIILVGSLIFYYLGVNKYSDLDKAEVIKTRVLTMDSLIQDIEQDIERGMYISSMRSLVGMSEFISENGSFITNFDVAFNEIMLNGTIDKTVINITQDANFGTWIEKIEDISSKLSVVVQFNSLNVQTYHDDPWTIVINLVGNMSMVDKKGIASWNREINISSILNIEDFEDPLYTITSKGKYTNSIVKSNITDFVQGSDASNLIKHANNSWYIASTSAPSFLMRFSGNLNSSIYGIESIINVDKLQTAAPELYIASSSSIDYIYFGNNTISNCQINETKSVISWLRLDNPHLATYESTCD